LQSGDYSVVIACADALMTAHVDEGGRVLSASLADILQTVSYSEEAGPIETLYMAPWLAFMMLRRQIAGFY